MANNTFNEELLIGAFGTLCDFLVDMQLCARDCPYSSNRNEDGECNAWQVIHDIRNKREITDVQPVVDTENMATVSDEFICKKCGIYLKDYIKVVMDEDNDGYIDEQHYEYKPKFCPECGAKVKDGDAE